LIFGKADASSCAQKRSEMQSVSYFREKQTREFVDDYQLVTHARMDNKHSLLKSGRSAGLPDVRRAQWSSIQIQTSVL